MSAKDKKRLVYGIIILVIFNFILIFSSIQSGIRRGDMMLRFGEHKTVTFISSLLLGFTALTSLFIFFLKKRAGLKAKCYLFWLLSAIGFIYLCMDEYFMAHEGMDEAVGLLFGLEIKHLNLDNIPLLFYGLIAVGVLYYFRQSVLNYKVMWPCLGLGIFCLVGSIVFHGLERINIIYEVIEESFKIVGVTFFFLAYFLTLFSLLDRLVIHPSQSPCKKPVQK